MRYYRLYLKAEGYSPLGYGDGGGRWNFVNTPLIYCSNTIALTMVEHFSISGYKVSEAVYELAELEIDYDIPYLEADALPQDWNFRGQVRETKEMGTLWAKERDFLCLKIPSARMPISAYPDEHNLLVNPLHPELNESIEVISTEEINFNLNVQRFDL